MSECVVNVFQPVHVKEHDCIVHIISPLLSGDGRLQPIKQCPIRQACQGVVQRIMLEPVLDCLLFANIPVAGEVAHPFSKHDDRRNKNSDINQLARAILADCLHGCAAMKVDGMRQNINFVDPGLGHNQILNIPAHGFFLGVSKEPFELRIEVQNPRAVSDEARLRRAV